MAEQEQQAEKKKPSLFWRIVKWIGLGLLTILLIAALVFRAPWKVVTLLLIFLLACTILPKPYRKWFWLSVGVVIIALIIWVFLPDETEGWRPYTFDKELAALEAKRAIPDSENAAIIYNQLLETWQEEDENEPNFVDDDCYDLTRSEPWLSKDRPEIAGWLKGQQCKIGASIEASKIEKCRFPISVDPVNLDRSMERLSAMRRWAYLLIRAANNDLGEGRIDQALEKQIASLQMAQHQYQQPTLIDMLTGIAMEALTLRQLNRFTVTGDATEERLNVVEEALEETKHNWNNNLTKNLEYEKLSVKSSFAKFYEVNPKGKIRLSRDPYAEMRAYWRKRLEGQETDNQQVREWLRFNIHPTYFQKKIIKAKTILGWFYIPSTPQKAAKIIDAAHEKYYAMAKPDFDWKKEPEEISITSLFSIPVMYNYSRLIKLMANMSERLYYRIHDLYLRVTADKRGSQLIIVLRRYKNKNGVWPASLDDIQSLASEEIFIDPFNNEAFVYKLTEDSFKLYSKGKNNIDEDGQYKPLPGEEYEPDDWPIWPGPGKSRRTQEKNTDVERQ